MRWNEVGGTSVHLPSVTPEPLLKCYKSIIFCRSQWLRRSSMCLLNCVGRAHFRDRCMVILYWLLCGGQTGCSLHWILIFKYLSRAVGEQMWANLRLERNIMHTKAIQKPYFVSHYVSSLIPCFNSSTNFHCQALAEGLKENSTLTNLNLEQNRIGPEGAKAWCLVRMVWRRGKQPQDFIGRIKIYK